VRLTEDGGRSPPGVVGGCVLTGAKRSGANEPVRSLNDALKPKLHYAYVGTMICTYICLRRVKPKPYDSYGQQKPEIKWAHQRGRGGAWISTSPHKRHWISERILSGQGLAQWGPRGESIMIHKIRHPSDTPSFFKNLNVLRGQGDALLAQGCVCFTQSLWPEPTQRKTSQLLKLPSDQRASPSIAYPKEWGSKGFLEQN